MNHPQNGSISVLRPSVELTASRGHICSVVTEFKSDTFLKRYRQKPIFEEYPVQRVEVIIGGKNTIIMSMKLATGILVCSSDTFAHCIGTLGGELTISISGIFGARRRALMSDTKSVGSSEH